MNLFRNDKPMPTIFDLYGSKENDMTAGLAYVMASCPGFLSRFVQEACSINLSDTSNVSVRIQTARSTQQEGITDIEIKGDDLFIVIEAKRGPILPSRRQLEQYGPILQKAKQHHRFLITISNSTNEFAKYHYNDFQIDTVQLVHLPWYRIKKLVDESVTSELNRNKHTLRDYSHYLGGILGMDNIYSNMVYVVSLAQGLPGEGWSIAWIDIIEKKNIYFYPLGKGWPDPPNYLGFRYGGRLQSIRRIESYSQFTNPRSLFPEAAEAEWPLHYCFRLGTPIVPAKVVKNGPTILRANRCWCMLDTLLTSDTISDAKVETRRRIVQGSV